MGLRVLRGARFAALARWVLVAAASAGTGMLLLAALGWALAHPHRPSDAAVRLVWCAVPVVVTVQFAVAAGRAVPGGWPRAGLAAVGLGRAGVALLAASATAIACAAGSAVALLVFLHLRGDLGGLPFHGAASDVLGGGGSVPLAGALTLLAVVPVSAAVTGAARLWPPRTVSTAPAPAEVSATAPPKGLPWGVALTAVGLAAEVAAPHGHGMPLPGGLGSIAPLALGGWAVATVGMVLAGPGVVHACGRLLAAFRPGALRLLAGRALQEESRAIGRPLGALCATAAAVPAVYDLHRGGRPFGPLTALAAVLVVLCVLATVGTALLEAKRGREPANAALRQFGASPALLRGAVALRAGVVLAAAVPLTALVAALATVPPGR
ncbi:hypothetical protein SAMN05216251_12160 [Actinacidiphila alni]|uniref:Uncharacterized protein n=1 Tax=Actinacidiphila alni TaxID=380248 RepID=A0A1I2K4C8_9ACTN|nr:hypothetical protein SAMN05216251_12160 [Actinacidiphila alni]